MPTSFKLSQDLPDGRIRHLLVGEHHLHQAGHVAAPGSGCAPYTPVTVSSIYLKVGLFVLPIPQCCSMKVSCNLLKTDIYIFY